jgi:hypothetical protein
MQRFGHGIARLGAALAAAAALAAGLGAAASADSGHGIVVAKDSASLTLFEGKVLLVSGSTRFVGLEGQPITFADVPVARVEGGAAQVGGATVYWEGDAEASGVRATLVELAPLPQ